MTLDRKLHIAAISLLGAAIVAGGISYVLDGTVFWIVVGVALLFVIIGMYLASRAGIEQRKREHPDD